MSMTIKTINPVYVNKTRESEPSKYLAFDSNGKPEKSKPNEVKSFQSFANSKGAKLTVDGKWGAQSESAWSKYGADFIATAKALSANIGSTIMSDSTPTSTDTTTEPTKEEAIKQAKLGKVWKKGKGWIDDQGGALAVLEKYKGFIEGIKGLFSKTDTQNSSSAVEPTPEYTPDGGKPKWSTTKKVVVIGGSALALGLIIFAIVKSKSKGK